MSTAITTDFNPKRLEEAVKARGLNWVQVADEANIPSSTLSNYKKGKASPKLEPLEKLADALDFPKEFFLRPITPGAKLTGPRLFRASCNLTKKAADQAENQIIMDV